MNSFLKSVNSLVSKRNAVVKDSLQKQLNTSVMEMQSAPGVTEDSAVGNCEESMTLCSILEGIFLHGLKDSLLNRMTEILSGPDLDVMPQPSFWGPLLVFSHRQIIDQVQNLSHVTTEVGYCRAWIRLALNEGILASYLCSIRRDNSALKPYYNHSAFIRDVDLIEVAARLIESLDYIRFELACNSSLLNFWSNTPLMIAGIWPLPMKSCPVFSAVDIAKTITTELTDNENFDEIETASSIGSLGSFNSSQSALDNTACIIEDGTLNIILANNTPVNISIQPFTNNARSTPSLKDEKKQSPQEMECVTKEVFNSGISRENTETNINKISNEASSTVLQDISKEDEVCDTSATAVGNSLIGKLGWSTSFEDCESPLTSSVISHGSEIDVFHTFGDGLTYDSIIQSYHTAGNSTVPDLQEFLKKYPKKQPVEEANKVQSDTEIAIHFDQQLGIIPREKGLDVQNYSCFECSCAIGMTFSKAYVCSYSGNYYCSKCMAQSQHIIPARIIHNWDLKRYPVSNKAAIYLQDCSTLLDMKILNPRIYSAVETMTQLQSLRIQLNLLRAYLFTCREPIIELLQRKIAPRNYLYENVHQYSVSDLLDIPNGTLAQQLQKVVEFARNHVINCWLCCQKGFMCEVCNNPKVIYPFDMESTYRCGPCNAVFHAECLNATTPCPKCERKRRRMELPLLDMGCTELPMDAAPSVPVDMNQEIIPLPINRL